MSNENSFQKDSFYTHIESTKKESINHESIIEVGADKNEQLMSDLKGKNDPDSIQTQLNILIQAGRFPEAVILIEKERPHEKWCDLAILALGENGNIAKAKEFHDWSLNQGNITLRKQCDLNYAQMLYQWAFHDRKKGDSLFPGQLTEKENLYLREVVDVLQFIYEEIVKNGKVNNVLETMALGHLINTYYALGDFDKIQPLSTLLATYEPIPLQVGQLILNLLMEPNEEVVDRLRKEHTNSFEARLIACMIEGELLKKYGHSFEIAKQLVLETKSYGEREKVFNVLNDIAQKLDEGSKAYVRQVAPTLLKDNERALKLFQVESLLQENKLEETLKSLDDLKDETNVDWLQLYANYLIKSGKKSDAVDYLLKAIHIIPHPSLLKKTVQVAYESGRLDVAADILEKILAIYRNDTASRINASGIYLQMGDYKNAKRHLKFLHELAPDNLEWGVAYAQCLFKTDNTDESLKVFKTICSNSNPPLEAYLGQAQILKLLKEPSQAFSLLDSVRKKFWDRFEFVAAYLDISHAAGEDKEGNEALVQLQELQIAGKAPKDILQAKSLDDVKEFIRKHREDDDFLHQEMLQGKAPWLMVDNIRGHVSVWGWIIRTQSLSWIGDEPLNWARYSIYSTNAFHVGIVDRKSCLKELMCPPKGSSIVIDLTALITLQQLELIDKVTAFFDEIYYPSQYTSYLLEETDKLVFHQLSQIKALREIKHLVDTGKISILKNPDESMPYINEHTPPEDLTHYYRLIDLIGVLHQNGKITDTEFQKVKEVVRKNSGVNDTHPPLKLGQVILIELSTLSTLCNVDLLKSLVPSFQIHISNKEYGELMRDIQAIQMQEDLYEWHKKLRELLHANPKKFVETQLDPTSTDEIKETGISLAAVFLTKQLSKPLLVDDRVYQVMALNDRPEGDQVAFGSDVILLELEKAGLISAEEMADYFLQLMEWRYRFVIPPSSILKILANRYREHPPGEDLRKIALYVHDCMRDPGLFYGPEKTEPPVPLAYKLFEQWNSVIGDFLLDIWADEKYNEKQMESLTAWVSRELFPSFPRGLEPRFSNLSDLLKKNVLGQIILQSTKIDKKERANKGLLSLAQGLGLGEKDYMKVVMEVIDGN